MIARRTLSALAGTAVAGLGMAVFAIPAQANATAVTVNGNLTLVDANTLTWDTGSEEFAPTAVVGSTVTITVNAAVGGETGEEFYVLADGLLTDVTDPEEPRVCVGADVEASWCFLERGDTYTYSVDPSASNQLVTVRFDNFPTTPLLPGGFYVSYPSSVEAQAVAGASPAPLIQQFGVPESGTCDEAASADLNWSGVASGGWGESWAEWIDDGDGGFVCTRTLAYNTSKAAWEVD